MMKAANASSVRQIEMRLQLLIFFLAITNPVCSLISAAEIENPENNNAIAYLSEVVINNENIYQNPATFGYKIINRTHWVTRKRVIEREIWLQPGDPVTEEDLLELERNLRSLDLFSHVELSLRPLESDPNKANLVIETRDKLSLFGVAGGTFLGGIGEVGFLLSETNLWGLGHRLQYRYVANTNDQTNGTMSYDNVLLYGKDVYGGVELNETKDGWSASATVENRFQNFDDRVSWKVKFKQDRNRQVYYDEGESVAEVPRIIDGVEMSHYWHTGNRESSWQFGPHLSYEKTTYKAAEGSQADTIDVPNGLTISYAGAFVGRARTYEYRKITDIDTLSFTQDLSLGYDLELLAGLARNKSKTRDVTQPLIFFNASRNNALTKHSYLNFGLETVFSSADGKTDSLTVSSGLTWFYTRFHRQTIATRLKYVSAYTRSGLRIDQSLGEDNGLRGYPAKEFNGEQALVVNLEHRARRGIRFASLEFGGVAFLDVGWLGDRGSREWLAEERSSVGWGVRIGSPQLLGSSVLRLDFAYPLTKSNEKEYKPTISFAVGQVFGFSP